MPRSPGATEHIPPAAAEQAFVAKTGTENATLEIIKQQIPMPTQASNKTNSPVFEYSET